MKIFLDIDDTLIHTDLFNVRPAKYLKEFLENVINKHDVYWLTTHCNGDATIPVIYLSKIVDEGIIPLIMRIRPTRWTYRKVDAINLDEEFLWFDDVLTDSEEKTLKEANKLKSHVMVNLDNNPDFLKDYLNI